MNDYIPNLEAGNKEDWETWLDSIQRISKLKLDFIIPGHGNVISGSQIAREITRASKIIETAIKNNKAPTVE